MRHHRLPSFLRHSHEDGTHAAPLFIQPYLHSLFLLPCHPREGGNPCGTAVCRSSHLTFIRHLSLRHSHQGGIHAAPLFIQSHLICPLGDYGFFPVAWPLQGSAGLLKRTSQLVILGHEGLALTDYAIPFWW